MKQTYVDYLEESTDVVRSKTRLAKIILVAAYFVIWAAAEIVFWFFASGADAVGYGIVFLWVLLPVTTFILSLLIGRNDYWGRAKWLFVILFGGMFMLVPHSAFSVENLRGLYTFRWPNFWGLPVGAALSLAGLGLGTALRHIARKKG